MADAFLTSKISSLELPNLASQGFKTSLDEHLSQNSIDKLGNVNIFIGPNNTGKSRLMRTIANSEPQKFAYRVTDFDNLDNLLKNLQTDFDVEIRQHPMVNGVATFRAGSHDQEFHKMDFTRFSKKFLDSNVDHFSELQKILRDFAEGNAPITTFTSGRRHDEATLKTLLLDFVNKHSSTFELINKISGVVPVKPICYIPTFRTLNEFGVGGVTDQDDFIAKRVRANYQLKNHVDIFTGQSIYKRIRSMLLGDKNDRAKVKEYEKFLTEKLFDGREVTIIPKEKFDVIDVSINGEEKRIYELGDGIQSLIILTFPLYQYTNGLFFIEEPEVNLHPGMQRKLLEAIQEKNEHQYFLTTHSNHFLDLTIQYKNISVYLCKRVDNACEVSVVAYGDRSILEEIGAQNTSVFLTNKTVWIEGITDRFYLARFLDLYIQQNKLEPIIEDQDYSYVEYSGGNITHWSFLDRLSNDQPSAAKISAKRLCGQMILITDRDSADTKLERKTVLRTELGDRFIELPVREIENLLTPMIIDQVINEYEGEDVNLFNDVQQQDYQTVLLGQYIEDRFATKGKTSKRDSYKAESGTVKDKLAFCRKSFKYLKTYDDLSPQAQELAKNVYDFIKKI